MSSISICITTSSDSHFTLEVKEGDKYADRPAYHEDDSSTNYTIILGSTDNDSHKRVCFNMHELVILHKFIKHVANKYDQLERYTYDTTRITYKLSPPVPMYDYHVIYDYYVALGTYRITDGDITVEFNGVAARTIRDGVKTILDTLSWINVNKPTSKCKSSPATLDCENL